MKRMLDAARSVRSWTDATIFFWEYAIPVIVTGFIGIFVYWGLDRTPARDFTKSEDTGSAGYVQPSIVTAGTAATVHWFVTWLRNCDSVDLFQEIIVQTKTSTPQVFRLEKINVRSRSQGNWFFNSAEERQQWISREFFVPLGTNICTRERCEPIEAEYRATLSDYCNPIHKLGFPVHTESPRIKFKSNPL